MRHNVISNHITSEDHAIDWDNTRIMNRESNYGKRLVAEMFYIKKENAPLNSQKETEKFSKVYDKVTKKI